MTDESTPPGQIILSIVIPTYNERDNIQPLVSAILNVMRGTSIETIVVDDASPDGTGSVVKELGQHERVRLLPREGKKGLASAVFEGAAMAQGQFVAVLDADLSHDPAELPKMLAKAQEGYDVVIGSRFVADSSFAGQPLVRMLISRALNQAVRVILHLHQHDVLTGYALCRRDVLTTIPTRYSARGFKWLVELLATQRGIIVYEWPIAFKDREYGASKANVGEVVALGLLCARLTLWRAKRLARR